MGRTKHRKKHNSKLKNRIQKNTEKTNATNKQMKAYMESLISKMNAGDTKQ